MTHNHIIFIKPSSHKYVELCTRTFDECILKNFKFTKKINLLDELLSLIFI